MTFDAAWQTLSPSEQEFAGRSLERIATLSEAECQVFYVLGMCLNRREAAARLHVTAKAVDSVIGSGTEIAGLASTAVRMP